MRAPLDSWRVVDLTDLNGALCGRILADLGAEVIRVEPDDGSSEPSHAVAYSYRNANKRLCVAGRNHPERYREILDGLLEGADVLVDNLRPEPRRALGLDPVALLERHPRLVHVVMADFGLSGPRAGWRLDPLTAQAAGGTLHASGFPDLPPCWFPGFLGPDCASIYGAMGAVAAVADRRYHGRGQTVEISVQEAVLAGTAPWSVAVHDYLKVNEYLPERGTRNADGFYWVLPAKDGWVRTVIGNEKQWNGFVRLLGDPDVLAGHEWRDPVYRRMNADVVRLIAWDLLRDRSRKELFEQARQLGAALGVIHSPSEYQSHEQTIARGVFTSGMLPGLEGAPLICPPLRFSVTRGRTTVEPMERVPAGGAAWRTRRPDVPVRSQREPGSLLLEGVRVVEFGMAVVGPEVSLALSELGADVIKIESSSHLDVLRASALGGVNRGFAFNAECRGRRSVALDIDTPRGRELAFALCASADIIVENYRGGVLESKGLGYESVKASNPAVIYASSQGYGRDGPLAEMPSYGPLNLGFVGLHYLWNHPGAPYPCGTSLNHPDHVAGRFLAVGILAAIEHRARTGDGQHIELAQCDVAAYLRGELYLEGWRDRADPVAAGNTSQVACPHGVYRSAGDDSWLAISVGDDEAWSGLCVVLGWEQDLQLASLEGRLEHADEIDIRLGEWASARPAEDAATLLQDQGVTSVPVMGPLDHLADAHLKARGFIVQLEHPEVGSERHAGNPLRMSVTMQRIAASAPCLGADTEAVLKEVLGVAGEEVVTLVANGVCI